MTAAARIVDPAVARVDRVMGGPARRTVVMLLALVLALDAADKATLGAVAAELQRHLGITDLELGVLASASVGTAGIATVPMGMLSDRVGRTRLLAASAVLWSATLVLAGASSTYLMLLCSRIALGALGATAGPALASLIGDYFPSHERARLYGFILTGEIIGAGFGFIVAGEITAILSWRWGFWSLVLPGLVIAWIILRHLPEPERGGPSRIPAGAQRVPRSNNDEPTEDEGADKLTRVQQLARDGDVEANHSLVLNDDPTDMRLPDAVRYVLRVPTNRVLIIASALGWFFFAGVRTFAVIFIRGQYGVGQAAATGLLVVIGFGALAGVLIGGRLSDRLIRSGHLNARVYVAFAGYGLTPMLIAPGVLSHTLSISVPLFFAGTLALGAANPPVDAGRLDVMHHRLWGRAEGVRTLARTWAEAAAPVAFGALAQFIAGGSESPFTAVSAARLQHGVRSVDGLKWAFVIMLLPLVAGALIGLRARRTYAPDVASAGRSEELTS